MFSAHGVARDIVAEAARRDLPVIDATCPLVTKVHIQGRRYAARGRTIVLIGHAGHPEVDGTIGQIDAPVHLVSTVADVAALALPLDTPLAYVTQTTLSVDDTRGVIEALQARFTDVVGPDTCPTSATRRRTARRRSATCAPRSTSLLVVGAKNSSNSNRLREIGVEMGVPSYLIADGTALDPAWVAGIATVGLTAGASAPEELVQGVIAALRALGPGRGVDDGRHRGAPVVPPAAGAGSARHPVARDTPNWR